ncbi:MAG: DNA adenine methylase [Phycisphaerae bacterium]|nr:DNA adenine methylase [Phycisphaerae bacterium]
MKEPIKAPFPYFGGKSSIAGEVWKRFGDVRNYVECFFGSGAMLLGRPTPFDGTETVNDLDGMVANFWRAVQAEPDAVAFHADWPVNENDLHARHAWLVGQKESLQTRLEGEPDFYDAKIAGWWCWGTCCWIGSGFCSGNGPWHVQEIDGVRQLVHLGDAGQGVNRQLVHLGDAGQGVKRKLVHLGNAGQGVNRQLVHLGDAGQDREPQACGVSRKRPLVTNDAVGVANSDGVYAWMQALAARLSRVRVCCGDWSRVCGPTPTVKQGLTAVFLDPPYAEAAGRYADLYRCDCLKVANDSREWAIEQSGDKRIRIALCGYEGEHDMPADWTCLEWKARGGYGSQAEDGENENAKKERIWFSPHCLAANRLRQETLF